MYVLSKNKKNIKKFLKNFSIFTVEKNLCILHGHDFVMVCTFAVTEITTGKFVKSRSLTKLAHAIYRDKK